MKTIYLSLFLAALSCRVVPQDKPSRPPSDRPPWLGDAELLPRPPSALTLREICGLASNPGDLPLGQDVGSVHLRQGYFEAANDLGGVSIVGNRPAYDAKTKSSS